MDEKRVIERVFSAKGWAPPHNLGHAVACGQQPQQRADSCALARIEQPYHVSCFTRGGGVGDAPGIERGRPPASPAASRCASIEWSTTCKMRRRILRMRAVCSIDWCLNRACLLSGAVSDIGRKAAKEAPHLSLRREAFWLRSYHHRRRGVRPL